MVHQRKNENMTDLLFFIVLRTFPIRFKEPTGLFLLISHLIQYIYEEYLQTKRRYMKPIILSLLFSAACFAGCNNNRPKSVTDTTEKTVDSTSTAPVDATSGNVAADEMQKKMDELKKLTPLTTDQLKTLIPEEIMGMKRSSFNANSMMGFASAEATYRNENDDREITLNIFDCAGEAGAGIYSLNYWTRMSMQSESDNGYTKTVDFKGQRAVETYEKGSDRYELTYVASDRLLVSVKGEKTGLDAVRQVAQNLNLNTN